MLYLMFFWDVHNGTKADCWVQKKKSKKQQMLDEMEAQMEAEMEAEQQAEEPEPEPEPQGGKKVYCYDVVYICVVLRM